jgi:hypothetical protein
MPLLVACACGRQFQAREEHAGRQAKCPSCGQVLVIQGQVIGSQPPQAQGFSSESGEEAEEMNPRAAAVMLQREMQASKDAHFMRNILIGGGALLAIIGIVVFLYLPSNASYKAQKPN